MRAGDAALIRLGISNARKYGWAKAPAMQFSARGGLEYQSPLYAKAWERTMRAMEQFPPRPPR